MNLLFPVAWSDKVALQSEDAGVSYRELEQAVAQLAAWLSASEFQRVAVDAGNGPAWIILDLACQQASKVLVPIPPFFSPEQRQFLLKEACVEVIFTDTPHGYAQFDATPCDQSDLYALETHYDHAADIPTGTGKITFTSGSTGQPKGVCLSHQSQQIVAKSLVNALDMPHVRHQCLLPLATLLENVAGVYAPLLVGGTIVVEPADQLGFSGARLTNPQALLASISHTQAESLILVPELLMLMVGACQQGWQPPSSLRFIAVGGAHVPETLIHQARECGLPVYQGYGLSECASVNTLNVPGQENLLSVGPSLGHNQLHIEDGELVISGTTFLGYLNQPDSFYPDKVYTGDLVSEQDGFYFVAGRKKNILINSFGRNISPEWIESIVMATGLFSQVLLVGEGQPHCGALLVTRNPDCPTQSIAMVLNKINSQLPSYATIQVWKRVADFAGKPGMFTANGKIKRDVALMHYHKIVQNMYSEKHCLTEETEA